MMCPAYDDSEDVASTGEDGFMTDQIRLDLLINTIYYIIYFAKIVINMVVLSDNSSDDYSLSDWVIFPVIYDENG